jgi:DNA helicase IV
VSARQQGPRRVLEWFDEDGILTIEVSASVDEDEIGHIVLTVERRPQEWDEADDVLPSLRIQTDIDGTNATKVRDALDAAIAWGREYLS